MQLNNRKKLVIIVGVITGFIVLLWSIRRPGNNDLPPLDPFDYKSVALHFVYENGTIVRKMGKIVRASQIGDGGNVTVSYNVFHLYGEYKGDQTSGVCNVTLERDQKNKYHVTQAILTMEGNEYKISVKGFRGRGKGLKIF